MLKIAIPAITTNTIIGNYVDALSNLGAESETGTGIHPEECAGLLLPGGLDVNPAVYGQAPAPETEIDQPLDDLQMDILARFLALGKPVLGICRGHQLLNAAMGGTLIQHLPNAEAHMHIRTGVDNIHPCKTLPGSWLHALYGDHFSVNSSHHQAVDRPAEGFRVVQRSADGVIEAMEHETLPVWTVQWHPERMCFAHRRSDTVDGSAVFRFFLERCKE